MPSCHFCNDEGKPNGCPRCGLTPRKSDSIRRLHLEIPTDIIPKVYQGVMWESESNVKSPLKFKQIDEVLTKVYDKFLKGEIPNYSLFYSAPPKSGKNVFAYACMQTALSRKYSVAPMLSTGDWRRLHKISQISPFYKLFGKYQWDDLVVRDIVFISIDPSDDRYDAVPLIKTILDTRSNFDKPTFVISDYRLNDLVPKWNSDAYLMIYNSDAQRDYLRYPVILQKFE